MTSSIRPCGAALCALLLTALLSAQAHRADLRKLQPSIDSAIENGVAWLVDQQLPDGSWAFMDREFPNGQTALAVYTLLKSGLTMQDTAVRRGLAFLKRRRPETVYALSLQMMAYQATKDDRYKALLKDLLRDLLSWQESKGTYGYPGFPPGPGGPRGRPGGGGGWEDLSNTQYAALGLRAAMLAGFKIKRSVLARLITETLDYRESETAVKLPADPVKKEKDGYARTPGAGAGRGYAAGFFYHKGGMGHGREVTGSMTTAGLGVLLIARDCYGKKIPASVDKRLRRVVGRGLNWMRAHWTVRENPSGGGLGGRGSPWHYYYLYGLERVGSLLMEEVIAGHAWYLEGARLLVDEQRANGSWDGGRGPQRLEQPDTCFALLFLKRASWAGRETGRPVTKNPATLESDGGKVRIKGQGQPKLAMWVDGFADEVMEQWKAGKEKAEIRVMRVEYLIDGVVVKTVEGDQSRVWKGETFAAQHAFERPGTYIVRARVHLLPPGATRRDADTELIALESGVFRIEVTKAGGDVAEALTRALEKSELASRSTTVKTSSEASAGRGGAAAVDGLESSGWLSSASDKQPSIDIRLKKGVDAEQLVLTQSFRIATTRSDGSGPGRRRGGGRREREQTTDVRYATRVEVRINGSRKPTVVADLDPAGGPTHIALPRKIKIKRLKVTIVKRAGSSGGSGFTEIYAY